MFNCRNNTREDGSTMNKRHLFLKLLFCAYLILLIGCGPSRIIMNVKSYDNPDLNIAEYKRFSFLPINKEKPLMEKHLFSIIQSVMKDKGYVYDDKNPQFLISIYVGINSREVQGKVSSRPIQVYQPPPIGSKPGTYGSYQTQYVTEGGGTHVINTRFMKIDFIDFINKQPTDKINYVWQGEVTCGDSNRKGVDIDKCLIIGLLQDYPVKQDSSMKKVEINKCK